jgi:hypothetical protein
MASVELLNFLFVYILSGYLPKVLITIFTESIKLNFHRVNKTVDIQSFLQLYFHLLVAYLNCRTDGFCYFAVADSSVGDLPSQKIF